MDVIGDFRQVRELDDRPSTKNTRPPHEGDFVIQDEVPVLPPQALTGAFEHEPLARFLKSLTFEEHFMFSHYVQVIVPNMSIQCPVVNYLDQNHNTIRENWLLFGSTDINFLRGFLLAACRNLSFQHGELYAEWAIQYKLKYVQDLRESLSADDPAARRTGVPKALVLALDEVRKDSSPCRFSASVQALIYRLQIMLHDFSMASKHVLGAVQIIHEAGGLEILGLSDVVRCVLFSCVYGKGLLNWDPLSIERITL
ncbi:hypothetical protein CI238_09218 [Colletotrichum incanum]|uniref:Uncharacterized protein n=1 Tax=Colletotrichum incanum TaxID=1573173 RepID=A0A162P9M7_COLIC|nr:hypothetical protein CI238_09218 [Colletotrichum incanum]